MHGGPAPHRLHLHITFSLFFSSTGVSDDMGGTSKVIKDPFSRREIHRGFGFGARGGMATADAAVVRALQAYAEASGTSLVALTTAQTDARETPLYAVAEAGARRSFVFHSCSTTSRPPPSALAPTSTPSTSPPSRGTPTRHQQSNNLTPSAPPLLPTTVARAHAASTAWTHRGPTPTSARHRVAAGPPRFEVGKGEARP
jgi:hypothetical protein